MELYRYEPRPVTLSIKVNGVPTDADALPVATIASSQPDEISRAMTVTNTDDGEYSAAVEYGDVLYDKTFTVTWEYAVGGTDVTRTSTHTVVTPYNDISFLQSTVAPAGATEDEVRVAAAYAKSIIDSVCGQSFGQHYERMNVSGENRRTIVVNEPIVSLSTISVNNEVVYDSSSDDNSFTVSISPTRHGITIDANDDSIYIDTVQRFATGTVYQVSGIFGWTDVPVEVSQAHALLVNDWFCNDSKWKKNYVESVKAADWNLKYDSRVYTETGNFYADTLLLDYHHNAMVVP